MDDKKKIPTILIIGAGPGGLSLYHSIQKHHSSKFNVKIFDRESSSQERWQGHYISLNKRGISSLLYCTNAKTQSHLIEAIPDTIPGEFHGGTVVNQHGKYLFRPPSQQIKNLFETEKVKHDFIYRICHRDKLRNALLNCVNVQWGKKCVGYEECDDGVYAIFADGSKEFGNFLIGADGINSPIRKQKFPNLQINELGVTYVNVEIISNKVLVDKWLSIFKNSLGQKSLGKKGDSMTCMMRRIPIESDTHSKSDDQIHYKISLEYGYPTKLDLEDAKNNMINKDEDIVDDDNPEDVVKHVLKRITQLRPPGELTDMMLQFWSLAMNVQSDVEQKNSFKAYNLPRRRKFRDIDPLSIKIWKSGKVALLGDAAHATSPVLGLGANNAFQDAELLTKELFQYDNDGWDTCIKRYDRQMRVRSSKAVLMSRNVLLRDSSPKNHLELVIRDVKFSVKNFMLNSMAYIQWGI